MEPAKEMIAAPNSDALIGQTIGGCEIIEVLGQGGMGVIYKGRQQSLDRIIAVKVLASHLANDSNFVIRFQREARALARINHPNILAVYDVGDEKNVNFMIMELIEGRSLAALLDERGGPLPWGEATHYILQAAQGLEAAQAAGIIHRDIKPENLMVTAKGQIKVSDFGLAKESDDITLTAALETLMGTPAFMSPEQCDGKNIDGRSDIYSLGATFFRLVTGRLPFEGDTAMSMMYRHKHEALIPPHEVLPSVPVSLSEIIVKMMSKKREQRYQTMADVIGVIRQACRGSESELRAIDGPPPDAGAAGSAKDSTAVQGGKGGDTKTFRRNAPLPFNTGAMLPPNAGNTARLAVQNTGAMPYAHGGGAGAETLSSLPGMGKVEEGRQLALSGDELLKKGDAMGAVKAYRQALQNPALDAATRSRIDQAVVREVNARRQVVENLVKKGSLVEASRECRMLSEIDSGEELRALLKEIEVGLAAKRTLLNTVRGAISAGNNEEAIKAWDEASAELRDETLVKQIEQLRVVVVPASKLAAQAEGLSREGRLEEAITAFEDALNINPACEPARTGLLDARQKAQRVEFLLKEGYQFSLEQNYAKAIETWMAILEHQPGHPLATKSVVEACMAQAEATQSQGDLELALDLCNRAAQLDPNNKRAAKLAEELTSLYDAERQLIEKAISFPPRRFKKALWCWKEVLKINPANKRAVQQVQQLSKKRSGNLMISATAAALICGLGFYGYAYVHDNSVIAQARQAVNEKRFQDAQAILRGKKIFFKGAEAKVITEEAEEGAAIQDAGVLETQDRLDEAAAAYRDLASRLAARKPELSRQLAEKAQYCAFFSLRNAARAQLKDKTWEGAASTYSEMVRALELQPSLQDQVKDLQQEAALASGFLERITNGLKQEAKNRPAAYAEFQAAMKAAGELKKLDASFAPLEEFAGGRLQALGFDPKKYQELFDAGIKKLQDEPHDPLGAQQSFQAAFAMAPYPAAAVFAAYAGDLAFCENQGMSLYAAANPLLKKEQPAWGRDERKAAFCIDRFEWPNQRGATPASRVSYVEAVTLCESKGKKLCSKLRWIDACKGDDDAKLYPYGDGRTLNAGECNTAGGGVVASGAKESCKNSIGVYDMSGNLAEWTESDNDGMATVLGGSYATSPAKANCGLDFDEEKKESHSGQIGFRCCRDLP